MELIDIAKIRIDGGTQARAAINEDAVAEYATAMEAGEKLPPLVVFFDGCAYWLADGFHRFYAGRKCDFKRMKCEVRTGTRRDAILFAVGANASHGLRRTNEDKRNAVKMLLADDEWKKKSARWIADAAGVSQPFVSEIKNQVITVITCEGKDGKKYPSRSQPEAEDIPMGETAPPSQTESPPPDTKNDAAGTPIDDPDIADCFERYGEIRSLCKQLSDVLGAAKRAIEQKDRLYGRTNLNALQAAIGNARRELTINEPHAVCPSCGGQRPEDCLVCKGTKYATQQECERWAATVKV